MRPKLPTPDVHALAHSHALKALIASKISAHHNWLTFADFMDALLYTPELGYYAGGAQKFGAAGDFITAPEISPLFARALAQQAKPIMASSAPVILELGAGSGQLAGDLLLALEADNALPEHYDILDLSAELRARQRDTLQRIAPHLLARVRWLDALPERFSGLVFANELLDAMPAHLVVWQNAQAIAERGVCMVDGEFAWQDRPAEGRVLTAAQALQARYGLENAYVSEINLLARDWVSTWGRILTRGALLLIDYGFPQREFYHPQRAMGTLMCHYRHHAHSAPFYLPGLQDVTTHVDFTALAQAGCDAGLNFFGYTSQAMFLINCGITQWLEAVAQTPEALSRAHLQDVQAVQKLISPLEMGELFKVIALGKEIPEPLLGFQQGERSASL